jgi:hypothetical protein
VRWLVIVATVTGCSTEDRCVPAVWFVGPSVEVPMLGTNGDDVLVAWHRFDETAERQSTYHAARFDRDGVRVAGSELAFDWPYQPSAIVGAPDRALVTGRVADPGTARTFFQIQLASGELLAPVETSFPLYAGVHEGSSFLLASEHGVARIGLDGSLVEDMPLADGVSYMVTGSTVTWALMQEDRVLRGVRIARGGAALDATPRLIANDIISVQTASRGDEMVAASLSRGVLTWSVLGANGTVTTTTSMPPDASDLYGTALVPESNGYLLFVKNTTTSELGAFRVSPTGVAGGYLAGPRARQNVEAISHHGRTIAVYERSGQGSSPPAIDSILIDDGAAPYPPFTLETVEGHTDSTHCHWWE